MRVWLIKDGESLPVQPGGRKMRCWMLADALADRGHEVTWWSSTWSHQLKKHVADEGLFPVRDRVTLRLLRAGGYRKNISLQRIRHHRALARRFAAAAESEPAPDAIVCAWPIIEVADAALQFARARGIPVVVDVRDLWPDYCLEHVPRILHGPARFALRGWYRRQREIFQNADSIAATSEGILEWALNAGARSRTRFDRPFYLGYPSGGDAGESPAPPCPDYLRPFQGRTIFSFVGIFGSAYDLATICRAAERLAVAGNEDVHFVLGGTGFRFDEVSRRAGGLPNVSMPGWLDKEQVAALLRHSDVGLVPFYDGIPDAMPNKVFEYLSAGLPILTPLSGELRGLIEQHRIGGWYPDGDHRALVHQIKKLAGDGAAVGQMSQRARALFEQRFTARQVYGEYAAHVERLRAESATELASAA